MAIEQTVNGAVEEHEPHLTGWRRYVYSTNHKDIGTMYLVFAIIAGAIGGGMSVLMRMELCIRVMASWGAITNSTMFW
ncbi:MAG: hypothetical protein V6Z81_06235 [Parvularculales bacterium]